MGTAGVTLRIPATATFAACLAIVTVTTAIAVFLPAVAPVVRLSLSLLSALFVPGYLLVSTVFPLARDLDHLLRVCLSLACSFALIILFSALIALSPLDRSTNVELVSVYVAIVGLAIAATARHRSLPLHEQPVYRLTFSTRGLLRDRFTLIGLLFCVTLSAGALIGVAPGGGQATELSLVGVEGTIRPVQPDGLTVDVHSHESAATTFQLVVTWQGQVIGHSPFFTVRPGQTSREPLHTTPPPGTGPTPINVMLIKQGSTTPYRQLTVWVRTIPYRPA